jgi:hypothetical protein
MDKELKALKETQKGISKQYKSAQKLYDTQARELQQLQPQYEQSIIQGYESQRPMLEQTAQKSIADIGLQKEQTKQQRESALSTARRQYEQGLQKTQQLFGGVAGSSAGMAASDITGAEQMRQFGQATTQASQNLMQLGQAERDVQTNLTNALQQLEVRKQQDLMKLRDSFRQELNQINQAKGTLSMNKANAQLAALQDYNNRRRALDDMVTEQRMNLETYAQQLKLQAQYTPATAKVPDLTNLSTVPLPANVIASNIDLYSQTDEGLKGLTNAGWRQYDVGNLELWGNQRTGRTVDLAGNEYQPFTFAQKITEENPLSGFIKK